MSELIRIQLIQAEMQKQTASINVWSHLNNLDMKGLQFLYYAEYDIIYQSFEMKQAAYLQKRLVNNSKRQQNIQIQRKYEVLSQKNHNKIIRHDNMVDRLLNRLQSLWEEKGIPYFHRYYFQKNIDNEMRNYIESLEKLILNEEKLIKNQVHILYSIQKAILARQACLSQFQRFLATLGQSEIQEYLYTCSQRLYFLRSRKQKMQYQIQGYKVNKITDKKVSADVFQVTKFQMLGEIFHSLVKLTVHAIELISKWKDYLYSLSPDVMKKKQQIDYYFEEENYLLRIMNDNSFVKKSFLANYLKLSPKNDPFLLMPIMEIEKIQKNIYQAGLNSVTTIQQSIELKCLKRIFAPKSSAQLTQILSKTRLLVGQYQLNIKNRKIFDLKIIHKINNLDLDNQKPYKKTSKSSDLLNGNTKLRNSQISQKNIQKPKNFRVSLTSSQSLQKISYKNQQNASFYNQKLQDSALKSPKISNKSELLQKNSLLKLSHSNQLHNYNKKTPLKETKLLRANSFLNYKQNFTQNDNPQSVLQKANQQKVGLKMMNHKQLQIIKQELKNKIKLQLKLNDTRTSMLVFQKPELASYIESQVKKIFLSTRLQQEFCQKNDKNTFKDSNLAKTNADTLFVDTYSIDESQLTSHITRLYDKESLLQFQFMQSTKKQMFQGKAELLDKDQILERLPCVFFLKIKQKIVQNSKYDIDSNNKSSVVKILSDVIFTLKYLQKQSLLSRKHKKVHKIIQILYMTIRSEDNFDLQRTILKTVEFLFKYETAESIVFTFYYNELLPAQKSKVCELKSLLEISNCLIAEKYVQKWLKSSISKTQKHVQTVKMTEVKIHFSRKDNSKIQMASTLNGKFQRFHSNSLSLQIGLYGLFCIQKLNLTNTQDQDCQYVNQVNYDYLLTQILKNHLNSDYFLTLRNKAHWQHRLRVIIQNIMALKNQAKSQSKLPFIEIGEYQSISELNKSQNFAQKKVWSALDDLSKSNFIKMFSLQLSLSLPYPCKAFINDQGSPFFRFEVKSQVQVLSMSNWSNLKQEEVMQPQIGLTQIYLFSCFQKKNIRMGLFDGEYIQKFIKRQNAQMKQKGQINARVGLSDVLNSLCFVKSQNSNKSMKVQARYKKYVRNLFLPMIDRGKRADNREKSANTIGPIRCKEFDSISRNQSNQFIIGQDILWKYDINLANGVRYNHCKQNNDLKFDYDRKGNQNSNKKMGMVLFLIPQNIVIYSRLF